MSAPRTANLHVVEKEDKEKGMNPERQKALDAALSQIERAFGKGSVMKLGAKEAATEIETISTGSLGLDIALGIGGLPRGRVVEIYGPESSGKTTLALHVVAQAQKAGGACAFVDAEHALDPIYARKLGVDIDNLLISQPDTANRRLKSPIRSCVPARLTFWSSIPSPPLCRAPSSTAKWATATWACRRG